MKSIITPMLVAICFSQSGLADEFDKRPQVATAQLSPTDGSAIKARLTFLDTGKQLQVFGTGTGFDPNKHYHTLIYDSAAESVGARACIPSPANPLNFDQMQVAAWQPIGSVNRTLAGVRRGAAYVPLSAIGVVSVRRHDQTGPNVLLVRLSCGEVVP